MISVAELTGRVTSLRWKVSHSWLDHEIDEVHTSVALDRWHRQDWPLASVRWKALRGLAHAFLDAFDGFSAAALVDKLDLYDSLSHGERSALKSKLHQLHSELLDVDTLRTEYLARLESLERASDAFLAIACQAHDPAAQGEFEQHWSEVKKAGTQLKEMFDSRRIPYGVLLP